MFRKKRKPPTADIYHKVVKTWYGGTKIVPTTASEQKKLKAALDKESDKLSWIDEIEDIEAIFDD